METEEKTPFYKKRRGKPGARRRLRHSGRHVIAGVNIRNVQISLSFQNFTLLPQWYFNAVQEYRMVKGSNLSCFPVLQRGTTDARLFLL